MSAVLVDTSILSLVFRRSKPEMLVQSEIRLVSTFKTLAQLQRVFLIGAIRQELLSGVRAQSQFEVLERSLNAIDHLPTQLTDYNSAAESYNRCRARGIAGGSTDMLLCAVALRSGHAIFTADPDFTRYASAMPIRLYNPAAWPSPFPSSA